MSQIRLFHFKGLRPVHVVRTRVQLRFAPRFLYSSNAPSPNGKPDDNFNKTGEKDVPDPTGPNMGSDEYSKSGGDNIVAEQSIASFKSVYTTDPAHEKELAGRGNTINPLEYSPASPEISRILEEQVVVKNIERSPDATTGPGITRKSKRVERTEIDFRPK